MTLSPITVAKLRDFARRRRMLIAVRGFCVGIVALLVVMSLIAAVDAAIVIRSMSLRWGLSLGGYALVAAVIYLTCLRLMWRIPGPRELARLIEAAEPSLREDLISAVELGADHEDARFDSPTFRSLLQGSVASRMERVRIETLLPPGLIGKWVQLACAILTICIALMLIPGFRFANRLTRALMPAAPVDRVSNVRVKIVAPNPADPLVPHNDAVNVIVELTGPDADRVVLETERTSDERGSEEITMKPAAAVAGTNGNGNGIARRYTGTIQLGREPVIYRIVAGDAVTRDYTIRTGARPHIAAFTKTYRYPNYAGLDAASVTETAGDLSAIEGTTVELSLAVDQPMEKGELRLELADSPPQVVPLTIASDKELRAAVPITKHGTYKVHLIARETRFDNQFDPPYEINAKPDAAPVVTIEQPRGSIFVPPGDAVRMTVTATDDLGLDRVWQSFRINDGNWVEVNLADKPGKKWQLPNEWDLYELSVKPGDQVTTRFAATDRAGHTSESGTLRITISTAGFDSARLAGITAKRRLLAAVDALETSLTDYDNSVTADLARLANAGNNNNGLDRDQAATSLLQTGQRLSDDADRVFAVARDAAKANATGSEAYELVLVARILGQLRDDAGATLAAAGRFGSTGDAAAASAVAAHAGAALKTNGAALHEARAALSVIVSGDQADVLRRDLSLLAREQANIDPARLPDEPATWQRLSRRQEAILAQVKQIESIAADLAQRGRGPAFDHAAKVTQSLTVPRASFETALAKAGKPDKAMARDIEAIRKGVAVAQQASIEASALLAGEVAAARGKLELAAGAVQSLLPAIRQHVERTGNATEQNAAAVKAVDQRFAATLDTIKSSGAAHEFRSDNDAAFIADLGLLRRAVQTQRGKYAGQVANLPGQPDAPAANAPAANADAAAITASLTRIADAFAVLEAGHTVAELHTAFAQQAGREKWLRSPPQAVTLHPRDWRWSRDRLASAPAALAAAKMEPKAAALLTTLSASPVATAIEQEMNARRTTGAVAARRGSELDLSAKTLAEAKQLISGDMDRARAVLAAEAPALNEMMAKLAQDARALEKEARAAAEKAPDNKPAENREKAAALAQKQDDAAEKLAEITDALRHEANAQDAFTEEGRERARDADDAAAILRDPAAKAEQALQQAAAAPQAQQQESALKEAAAQDGKLAEKLDQLAKHFENLKQGKGEDTRSALREAEKDLGIKRDLDAEFGKMEKLAELAAKPPAEQLADLEKELKQNPAMQRELSQIAQDAANQAKAQLDEAAAEERKIAQDLEKGVADAEKESPDAARDLAKLAQKAGELAKQAPPIAKDARKGAAPEAAKRADNAERELNDAAAADPQPKDPAAELARDAKEIEEDLKQAAQDFKQAEKEALAAAEQVREAERQATATLAVGNAGKEDVQKASQTLLNAKPQQDAAKRAAVAAKEAGQKAEALAKEAEQLAKELADQAGAADDALAQAAKKQEPLAEALDRAGDDVARAARHEKRLENQPAAEALAKAADEIEDAAKEDLPKLAEKLEQEKDAQKAQGDVRKAEKDLAQQAKELAELAGAEAPAGDKAQANAGEKANGEPGEKAQADAGEKANGEPGEKAQANAGEKANAEKGAGKKDSPASEKSGQKGGEKGSGEKGSGEKNGEGDVGKPVPAEAPVAAPPGKPNSPRMAAAKQADAGAPEDPAAKWMARALDELDRSVNGAQPSPGSALAQAGQPPQGRPQPSGQGQSNPPGGKAPAPPPLKGSSDAPPAAPTPGGLSNLPGDLDGSAAGEDAAPDPSEVLKAAAIAQSQSLAQSREEQASAASMPGNAPGPPGWDPGVGGFAKEKGNPGAGNFALGGDPSMATGGNGLMAGKQSGGNAPKGEGQGGGAKGNSPTSDKAGNSSGGASVEAGAQPYGQLPGADGKRGDWGKLPAKLARELMEGSRDEVSGEYRSSVEAYFRAVAAKAREKRE